MARRRWVNDLVMAEQPAGPLGGGKPPARAPLKRDAERTSAAILDAATQEFMEKGFGGARIDAIAARAKINKRMLYHYFGDKEALYVAVLESAYVAIRTAEHGLRLTERGPAQAMRELALFTWQYFLDHPEFLSLLATENLHKAAYLKRSARIFDLHSPLVDTIRGLLARGAQEGVFRADADPVRVYMSIASLGFFYLSNRHTLSVIFGRNLARAEETAAWGEHIVTVVLSYLRPQ
jgi:AcrR family transcriptional regulator